MNALRNRGSSRDADSESGFTLVEVVVATAILAILATASLAVYVASLDAASSMQRRQVAITIANESLESASSWTVASDATGTNDLTRGRKLDVVVPVWMDNLSAEGVSQTYPKFDTRATATSPTSVPISRTVQRNGTTYDVESLIGTCYQPIGGGDCAKTSASGDGEDIVPGFAKLTRVMIVVKWTAGDSCADDGCSYQATTLVDANSDLEWDTGE